MNVLTTKLWAPTLGLTVATVCIAVSPARATAAEQASRQETIGVTTGLTIGALAGGPFGAIFGAAAGAWLGDRYHKQQVERASLAADLTQSKNAHAELETALMEMRTRGEQLAQSLDRTRDLETQIIFRTSDAEMAPDAIERLQKLGVLASTLRDVKVRVSGYADPRGTEEFNTALSQHRADAVAVVLASAGIDTGRLVVEAHGESATNSTEGDLDGYALERRVIVRIEHDAEKAVAQRN